MWGVRSRFLSAANRKGSLFKADWRNVRIAPPHKRSKGKDAYKWMEVCVLPNR